VKRLPCSQRRGRLATGALGAESKLVISWMIGLQVQEGFRLIDSPSGSKCFWRGQTETSWMGIRPQRQETLDPDAMYGGLLGMSNVSLRPSGRAWILSTRGTGGSHESFINGMATGLNWTGPDWGVAGVWAPRRPVEGLTSERLSFLWAFILNCLLLG